MKEIEWDFYKGTEDAWEAMLVAIRNAKHSIDLEQYILINDEVGSKFINLLIARANEGIKIRILCDEVGSYSTYLSNIASKVREAGGEMKFFNTLVFWHPHNESLWFFRDHRKLMIVDDKIGFTGGICISEQMKGWRESSVRITGPVVSQMKESFEIMWYRRYRKPRYYFKKKDKFTNTYTEHSFSYLSNSPIPRKRYILRELIKKINSAKYYIYLTTPYFAPEFKLQKSIKKAAQRGVKIVLLLPLKTNVKLVDIASRTYFDSLFKNNVRIFQYEKSMIHSKTAVIDGLWSTIGSLNLDNASLLYNFEGNLVSTDKKFTFELEKQFLDDLRISNELTYKQFLKRSLLNKALEVMVKPLRSFL